MKQSLIIKQILISKLSMTNTLNLDHPDFTGANMEAIVSLLVSARGLYRSPPLKKKRTVPKEILEKLKPKYQAFAMKPFKLMSDFENDAYWNLVDEMARTVLSSNPRAVLYTSQIFNSTPDINQVYINQDGTFSKEGVQILTDVVKNICIKLKEPSFIWQVSESFSFQVKVQKKNEEGVWQDIPFKADIKEGDKDEEVVYKIFPPESPKDCFYVKDARSVLLAIMLPMRILHPYFILVGVIAEREKNSAAKLMNSFYKILSDVLIEMKHALPAKRKEDFVTDFKDSKEVLKSEKPIDHGLGLIINIVLPAFSAWKEKRRNLGENNPSRNSCEEPISPSEEKMLSEKWLRFKRDFDKISDENKNFVHYIPSLSQETLEKESQLKFFLKNKHSWTWPDFALGEEPDNDINWKGGKSGKRSMRYFETTEFTAEEYSDWIKVLNIVLIFLRDVKTQGKYVDFETKDNKTASYIYWVFMFSFGLENKINFFKIDIVRKCIQNVQTAIRVLRYRKDNGGHQVNNNRRLFPFIVIHGDDSDDNEPDLLKKMKTEGELVVDVGASASAEKKNCYFETLFFD